MSDDGSDSTDRDQPSRITVESSTVDGIVNALGLERVEPEGSEERETDFPDELGPVLETLADIFSGVEEATEQDSRGRSRKMVRQYADREDLSSDDVGFLLRVLEIHDLVVQDGNRWRVAEPDEE